MIWWCVISTLCLQVGHRLGFWGGFSCFISYPAKEVFLSRQTRVCRDKSKFVATKVSLSRQKLFACLIRAAIFRLPPSFVVWSFFLCHRHLWSVLSFFATGICVHPISFTAFSTLGIRVRLFVFALLALVWGYQCTSPFLVSCYALANRQPSGRPRGQPASILCSMDRRLTNGWPWF